jgi:hypothetical protein
MTPNPIERDALQKAIYQAACAVIYERAMCSTEGEITTAAEYISNRAIEALTTPSPAVLGLVEAARAVIPRGVCLSNANVRDSEEVPLIATLGELRALADALQPFTDAQEVGR